MGEPGRWRFLVVAGAMLASASVATAIYLPALPSLARSLHTGIGQIAFTIPSFLVGFSLGQLVWGPIGDRFGRRGPALVGMALFIVGSIGCARSSSIGALILWRVVQALGGLCRAGAGAPHGLRHPWPHRPASRLNQ